MKSFIISRGVATEMTTRWRTRNKIWKI